MTKSCTDKTTNENLECSNRVYEGLQARASYMYYKMSKGKVLFFKYLRKNFGKLQDLIISNSLVDNFLNGDNYLKNAIAILCVILAEIIGVGGLILFDIVTFPIILLYPYRIKMSKIERSFRRDKQFFYVVRSWNNKEKLEDEIDCQTIENIKILFREVQYIPSKYDLTYVKYDRAKHVVLMPSAIYTIYIKSQEILSE